MKPRPTPLIHPLRAPTPRGRTSLPHPQSIRDGLDLLLRHGLPLILVTLGLVAVAGFVRAALCRRWRRLSAAGAHYLAITPPVEVDADGVEGWWANMAELLRRGRRSRLRLGPAHVALEYRWIGRELTIGLWLPGTMAAAPVAASIVAAWPGAVVTARDARAPIPASAQAVGGALIPVRPAWYPLRSDHKADPLRALIGAASGLRAREYACVQVLARLAPHRRVAALRRGAVALRTGERSAGPLSPVGWLRAGLDLLTPGRSGTGVARRPGDPLRERDGRAAIESTDGTQWLVGIRYAVANDNPRGDGVAQRPRVATRLRMLAHAIVAAFGAYTAQNRLGGLVSRRDPLPALAARRMPRGAVLSVPELAALAGLPRDTSVPGLDRARSRIVPAPIGIATGGRGVKVLGRAQAGGHAVGLSVVDAREHVHILGATGSGKSTLQTAMILDEIAAGRGVAVIDTKGDLVSDILDRLHVDTVRERLVLIDPDQPGGAVFNPLEGDDPDLVVDNIVAIFSHIFAKHWGPRMDDVLRVACLTLLRKANATLPLVIPLLNDRAFRAPYTADLDDPAGLRGFWEWFETAPIQIRATAVGSVESRLRQFLVRPFVRETLSAARSSFDMTQILDGGILLARLPKGQIGDDAARIMGSFVFASIWQAATARSRLPEARRRDASVYIDEAHNVLNLAGGVSDMLAEARGYHLSLVLAHQHLGQLPRDAQLALSANARNKIFFACSPEDARSLADHTAPELAAADLIGLGAYTAAARLIAGNRATSAFTLATAAPRPVVGETTAIRQAIALSRDETPTAIEQLARRSSARTR